MVIEQSLIDHINSKAPLRVLKLPVRRGPLGELKHCPVRRGGIYQLVPPTPYSLYRLMAEEQPTRALAVLWLIDRCNKPGRTATITVTGIDRSDKYWTVRFERGERQELLDQPRLLAARPGPPNGDYTTIPAIAMQGEPEAISAALQEQYVKTSKTTLRTARNGYLEEHVQRLQAVISDIRTYAKDPITNKQLRGLERQAKSLERRLSA